MIPNLLHFTYSWEQCQIIISLHFPLQWIAVITRYVGVCGEFRMPPSSPCSSSPAGWRWWRTRSCLLTIRSKKCSEGPILTPMSPRNQASSTRGKMNQDYTNFRSAVMGWIETIPPPKKKRIRKTVSTRLLPNDTYPHYLLIPGAKEIVKTLPNPFLFTLLLLLW